ncbi:MAG: hypothetical protein JO209_00590 [Acidisphaera sp.]|nr:hypothetical protein [Acidisphaera sp.]
MLLALGTMPARALSPYDGHYAGDLPFVVTGNNARAHCQTGMKASITVGNGAVSIPTLSGPVATQLAADGSFTMNDSSRVVTGKIANGVMTGTWSYGPCTAHFELHKDR